jgi:glycolate oxidase iron-sulfur subunit
MQLLARAGCEVVVCPHVCCGLPPYSYGELASTRELAGHNLKLLGDVEADYIVTDCGSCGRFLKRYPELLAEAEGLRRQAERLATKVRDFTELLSQLPLPAPIHPPAQVITYHDPCHLGRGQGLTAEPRRLLREAAGANLVELPDADWCCGGAGTYSLVHADRSGRILRRKVDNIAGTGASVLATACPACILQIRHGLRQSGLPVAVRHVAEIVAEAQGLALIS